MENLQSNQNKMETKMIKEKDNPFLERTEITLEIKNKVAPSFDEVKAAIGKDKDLTVIKKINANFGKRIFIAEAVIYDNAEAKGKIETIPKKIRKKMEAEKKAAVEAAKKVAHASVPSDEGKEAKEEEISTEEPKDEPKETEETKTE